ncbi:hypothetical protein PMAC_000968 [Pneumocystis sp. 'macacae']|nr:hypothetical protein PMAC_000968 [Pneumocystis sp. 'macacae']
MESSQILNTTGDFSRSKGISSSKGFRNISNDISSRSSENTYIQSRNKLLEVALSKHDQNTHTSKYKFNYNNHHKEYGYEDYTPYNNDGSSDEDVEAIKQEMRFIKQDSLSSTRNAIRTAIQAEETGRQTLMKLGTQSERIGTTEKYLDLTAVNAKMAEEKNKALKQLNRSVFIPHFKKPWKKQTRLLEREQRIRDQYELEQLEREKTKKSEYESFTRIKDALNTQKNKIYENKVSNDPFRCRFEPDEEDNEIEDEINQNLFQLGNIASQLKAIATATQEEITSQNTRLDRISEKGHRLDAEIHINAERLKRIN